MPERNERVDWEELHARMRGYADEATPEAFMFEEPGDELLGVVVAVNLSAATRFGWAPVVTIRRPSGDHVSLWLLHAVLRREFERQAPQPGEVVFVRYQGHVHPEGGQRYESYVVRVDRPQGTNVDWATIAGRYGDDVERDPPPNTPEPAAVGGQDDDIPF